VACGTPTIPTTEEQGSSAAAAEQCASGPATYRGGSPTSAYVMTNIRIVAVAWGNTAPLVQSMTGFYRSLVNSPYLEWLSEYYVTGTHSFYGLVNITPNNTSTVLSDSDIATELAAQIRQGNLPAPDSNEFPHTYYAVYTPPGFVIHDNTGEVVGCNGAADGYHFSANRGSLRLVYGVMPDGSCWSPYPWVRLSRLTSVSAHELAEAATDPFATTGWTALHCNCRDVCEIGDMCGDAERLSVPELGDRSYQVESLWDNSTNGCIAQKRFQSADIAWRSVISPDTYIWKIPNGGYYGASYVGGADTTWHIVGSGDINGDGTSDLVWWNELSGDVYVWFVESGGYAGAAFVGEATLDWTIRAVADVDGDGIADLVWSNSSTGQVYTWILDSYGYPVQFGDLGLAAGWVLQGSGDFNGDGMADLLFTRSDGRNQHIGIWLLYGTGVLSYMTDPANPIVWTATGEELTIGANHSFGGIGDFNADGISDVVWQGTSATAGGSIDVWTLTPRSCSGGDQPVCIQQSVSLGETTAGFMVSAVADANGDHVSDLVFRNAATGDVYTWLTVWGPQPGSAAAYTGSATTDWSVVASGFFNIYPQVW
jgi:hypothetical protein